MMVLPSPDKSSFGSIRPVNGITSVFVVGFVSPGKLFRIRT